MYVTKFRRIFFDFLIKKETTGATLFDWTNDKKLLHEGPFEFKVLSDSPPSNQTPWCSIIENVQQEIKQDLEAALDDSDDDDENQSIIF